MVNVQTIAPPSAVQASLRRNRLGIFGVSSNQVAALSVLLVVAGLIPAFTGTTGITSAPIFFLAVGGVLLVFSDSYVAMSGRIRNAGAFYAFAVRGLGRPTGVGVALVAVLAYNLLQIGLYGIFGATAALFGPHVGLTLPWFWWALIAWGLVFFLGLVDIGVSGKVLAALSGAEILVGLVIFSYALAHAGPAGIAWATLAPANLTAIGAAGAFAVTVTGYVGFEVGAAYSEEARDPRRTVRTSTFLVVGGIAVVYVLASLALPSFYGVDQVATQAQVLGPDVVFDMVPVWLGNVGRFLLLTSIFAGMLAFHLVGGRYMFSLGRERVLPAVFGEPGRRHGAPWFACVVQSVLAFVAICVYTAMHWDPLIDMFYWLGTTGGFGVLVLLAITSASIVAFFARRRNRAGESVWRRVLVPAVAGVALGFMVVAIVINFGKLLGVAADSLAARALPGSIGVVFVIGVVVALVMRANRSRSSVYAGIGLGPKALVGEHTTSPVGAR